MNENINIDIHRATNKLLKYFQASDCLAVSKIDMKRIFITTIPDSQLLKNLNEYTVVHSIDVVVDHVDVDSVTGEKSTVFTVTLMAQYFKKYGEQTLPTGVTIEKTHSSYELTEDPNDFLFDSVLKMEHATANTELKDCLDNCFDDLSCRYNRCIMAYDFWWSMVKESIDEDKDLVILCNLKYNRLEFCLMNGFNASKSKIVLDSNNFTDGDIKKVVKLFYNRNVL